MKFKQTRKDRTCSNCNEAINKGDMYGQKSTSTTAKETSWSIDNRPTKEIPDWAWSNVRFSTKHDWCKPCGQQKEAS